jgi:guanylate kinase
VFTKFSRKNTKKTRFEVRATKRKKREGERGPTDFNSVGVIVAFWWRKLALLL